MKKFILVFLCLYMLFSSAIIAQTGSGWGWATTSGTANVRKGIADLVTDAAGNVYATGAYNDALTLGAFTVSGTPAGSNHAFIVKYDNMGNVLWLNNYNGGVGAVTQTGSVVALDAAGNVYMGGIDNSSGGNAGHGFVTKYSNSGAMLWSKIFSLNEVIAINIGPDGNPIVIESIPGKRNIYKLNEADGTTMWTVTNTGTNIPVDAHSSYSQFLDAAGNVYYNIGSSPFGGSNTTEVLAGQTFINPGYTSFIVSLDNNGNTRWVDSARSVQGNKVTVSSAGKLYVFLSTYAAIGGTNQTPSGSGTYYELDNLGKVVVQSFSSFQNFGGQKLYVKDNGIYTAPVYRGGSPITLAFGDYTFTTPAANTTNLNVIVKYDVNTKAVVWANSFETTGAAYSAGGTVAFDINPAGKVVVGGSYGIAAKFGTITKTATQLSSPATPMDCFTAEFDGANVAAPPSTTWTGAAGNGNFNDAANWNNGVPNGIKTIIPGGLTNYPNNITSASRIGKLEIGPGAVVNLPLSMNIPLGIVNNGAIELTESGIFYGGFNTGQTLVTGTGKIVIKNNAVNYFGYVVLNNSLEINCTGSVTSFGGTITGSLFMTNGIYLGDIYLSNAAANVTYTATSFVAGNLKRAVNTSGTYYFPVGSAGKFALVQLDLNNINGPHSINASFTTSSSGNEPNTTAQSIPVTQLLNGGNWTVTPDVPLSSGNYNITTSLTGFTNQVSDAARYVVLKRINSSGSWAFFGQNGISTQTPATVTATADGITSFSDFAIGIASNSVATALSVQFTNLAAKASGKGVLLSWQTIGEINNKVFNVERSTDGSNWIKIGEVSAKRNNDQVKNYEFMDANPEEGNNYYRLKQIDLDGRSEYSSTISAIFKRKSSLEMSIFPNPVTDALYIKGVSLGKTMVKIFDGSGKVMLQTQLFNNKLHIPVNWPAGTYSLQINTNAETKNVQFIKIK